jgi:hypothetical protein
MYAPETVTRIGMDTIDTVFGGSKPVLLACLRVDKDYQDIMDDIEVVALFAGTGLKVCLALGNLLPYFEKRFSVSGTPMFLVIHNGILLDSIQGKIPAQCLLAFIRPYVPGASRSII